MNRVAPPAACAANLDAMSTVPEISARPEPGAQFFSGLTFCALPQPLRLRAGEQRRVAASHDGKQVETWLSD